MAEQIRGTIQQVPKPREFKKGDKVTLYYSIKVNDVYYSAGSKKPPEPGTLVEFWAEQNDKGYWGVTKDGLKVVQAQAPTNNIAAAAVAGASNSVMLKDDYWKRKEDRELAKEASWEAKDKIIQLQSCRNSAIEFVKLLLIPVTNDEGKNLGPALKLPAAVAKREAVLFETVKKYTQEFVNDNSILSSENNNKNEQLPQVEASSAKDSESVADDDGAWAV